MISKGCENDYCTCGSWLPVMAGRDVRTVFRSLGMGVAQRFGTRGAGGLRIVRDVYAERAGHLPLWICVRKEADRV